MSYLRYGTETVLALYKDIQHTDSTVINTETTGCYKLKTIVLDMTTEYELYLWVIRPIYSYLNIFLFPSPTLDMAQKQSTHSTKISGILRAL